MKQAVARSNRKINR